MVWGSEMTDDLLEGWLNEQLLLTKKEVENWPHWMKGLAMSEKNKMSDTDPIPGLAEAVARWETELALQEIDDDRVKDTRLIMKAARRELKRSGVGNEN